MIEISIISDELNRNFSEAVRMASDCGIHRLEIRTLTGGRVPACTAPEIAEVDRILRNESISLTALSPGLFKHTATEPAFRYELNEQLPLTIELARRWNITRILVFGFSRSTHEDPVQARQIASLWLAEAAEIAAAAGVTLLLEPEPICLADTGLHADEMIRSVNSPALAMNYDPGNVAWQTGMDPGPEIESIASIIRHIHLKDIAVGSSFADPRWVQPGDGIVNFETIFRALQRHNYTGELTLEPHLPYIDTATLRNLKERIIALWSRAAQHS